MGSDSVVSPTNTDAKDKARTEDAQAELDALRHQAGGALTGSELRSRKGMAPDDSMESPPLDWRLTPTNVILQLLVIGIFMCVVGFLGWLAWDGVSAVFGFLGFGE